jgi:hypothetical protein
MNRGDQLSDEIQIRVPSDEATWYEIGSFALSFNGYERFLGDIGLFANETARTWRDTQVLPDDLTSLRSALFYEQRHWHHFGDEPDETTDMPYVRALVRAIRTIVGPTLLGTIRPNKFMTLETCYAIVGIRLLMKELFL